MFLDKQSRLAGLILYSQSVARYKCFTRKMSNSGFEENSCREARFRLLLEVDLTDYRCLPSPDKSDV